MPNREKAVLYPPFAEQLTDFESRLVIARLPFFLFMGLRSWAEQAELYAQGRTKPGSIVTNARPGSSLHNYGLAADYVLDGMIEKPGIQWSWDIKADLNHDGRNDWLQMAEIAAACGLDPGWFWKKFPDAPHVENKYGLTLNEIREIYAQGGNRIESVWAELKAA
jgi:peptidoglycan LD-endopeptidase CwlK